MSKRKKYKRRSSKGRSSKGRFNNIFEKGKSFADHYADNSTLPFENLGNYFDAYSVDIKNPLKMRSTLANDHSLTDFCVLDETKEMVKNKDYTLLENYIHKFENNIIDNNAENRSFYETALYFCSFFKLDGDYLADTNFDNSSDYLNFLMRDNNIWCDVYNGLILRLGNRIKKKVIDDNIQYRGLTESEALLMKRAAEEKEGLDKDMKTLNGIKNDFIRLKKRKNGEKDWYEVNDEDYNEDGYLSSSTNDDEIDRSFWN